MLFKIMMSTPKENRTVGGREKENETTDSRGARLKVGGLPTRRIMFAPLDLDPVHPKPSERGGGGGAGGLVQPPGRPTPSEREREGTTIPI